MKLTLKRIAKRDTYTIGNLYIDGKFFCNTIEDKDRGLDQSMTDEEILKIKVPNETAIPTGTYKITLNVVSPKYSQRSFYQKNANKGRVPRLLDVKGFAGVLIHCGNLPTQTQGCILVGVNNIKGQVTNSKNTFIKLYKELLKDRNNITLTIS